MGNFYLKKFLKEEIVRQIEEIIVTESKDVFILDEMAYPISFNFEEFKKIRSFAGKQKYAKEHLLEKIGQGSSRAVFKVDEEKVIKIALNKKGISQNQEEAEGYKQNYSIIAKVFEVDTDDMMWVEMEYAKKLTPTKFKQLTNISLNDLSTYLRYEDKQNNPSKYKYFSVEIEKELLEKIRDNDFVNSLMEFVFDYQYPIPGDFGRISSYGEVIRDGNPTVVLVDFGYSNSTSSLYKRG
jgi:hypothetical protein